MLKSAPKFFEVAKRIVEITEDCIIVAHNAEFDYRILRTEFKRLGYPFKRKTLCTVGLSQQLIPNQDSYSLGKLTRALGIPVTDRHRANGDALATIKLFKLLLAKDIKKSIVIDSVKVDVTKRMSESHLQLIESLPAITGVYYLHDADGTIIYIGKSKNIKHRVNQHLTKTDRKSRKIQDLVKSVTYESTGSELVALLKENEEIKRNTPKFNSALKHKQVSHGMYSFTDTKGYINLKIEQIHGKYEPITTFGNFQSAKSFMFKMVESYELCQKLTGLDSSKKSCFNHSVKLCKGACIGEESIESYNVRVAEVIAKNSYKSQNLAIIDRGRELDERSVIYVKDGVFKGLGFVDLNHQINTVAILERLITPMENTKDTQHIIQSYLRKNKRVKTIPIQ